MTNKLPLPPTPNEVIKTINNIIDDKQDALVSGTNIKTINNESILGSGNISISGGSSIDVQINGTSITSNDVANIVTNTAYDASSNKIATMSDLSDGLDTKQDTLTAGTNINFEQVPAVDTRSTATVYTVGSNRWQEAAYLNNKFIVIGNFGKITTSIDGTNWTTPITVGSDTWRGIAYGNGKYVICGSSSNIAYSTDAEFWTLETVGNSRMTWYDVAYGNGQFIVCGKVGSNEYYITTSTDGVIWTTPQRTSIDPQSITYGNNKFVISGGNSSGIPVVAYSSNGTDWTYVTIDRAFSASSIFLNCVIFANQKFYAVGGSGVITTSNDGETWTEAKRIYSDSYTSTWEEIRYSGDCFVAVGASGYMATSEDGKTWTIPIQKGPTYTWYGLTYGNGKFLAVGDSGRMVNFEVVTAKLKINGANIVSYVDSTSTNNESVGAKLFYDTIGDIETALNTINSGS